MKKHLITFLLAIGFAFGASAQNDLVTTTITDVTATTVTAHFEMNDGCTQYAFMLDWQENIDFFTQMFGCTEEQYLLQFCNFFQTSDTTWVYDDLTPLKDYILFVVAHSAGNDPVIYRTEVTTLGQGTSDPSVISIAISEITEHSARVVFTPNEATMIFKDMLLETHAIDSFGGLDGLRQYIIDEGMLEEFSSTDDWVWPTLEPGRTYAAVAVGKNGDGVWGELCRQDFSTPDNNGIDQASGSSVLVYPNPTTGRVSIEAEGMRAIQLFDLSGREVLSSQLSTLDLSALPAGTYLMRVDLGGRATTTKIIKQ